MPTQVDIVLIADRYDAGGGQDPRQVEWPPHPARVVSALRSVAQGEDDLDTLRTLEKLPAPTLRAGGLASSTRSRAYVVTNTTGSKGGNVSNPGRTSGLRERRSVFPLEPRVQMIWDADLDETDIQHLDRMARRVPYLGRSTSVVLMGARRVDAVSESPLGLNTYRPCQPDVAELWLRSPYPGYVDELNALFGIGLSAWQASDGGQALQAYRMDELSAAGADVRSISSPYRDLVVLRFQGPSPAGRLAPIYAAALRSTVMSRTDQPLPPALHGHGFDGQPHVAYLGLPVVGSPHADGHLVALAVAVPGMSESERRRILRGVLGTTESDTLELRVPGIGSTVLRYAPEEPRPFAATARRWTRPAHEWVTVTPVVLDRFPKRRDLAREVVRSCLSSGLPEPESVEISSEPMIEGGVRLRPGELPARAKGRLFCHARIRFAEGVTGPVLIGAGRYFGVGLLAPDDSRERIQEGARGVADR